MACQCWVFMHVFKTGGTSLRELALRWVAEGPGGLYVELHGMPVWPNTSSRPPLLRLSPDSTAFRLPAQSPRSKLVLYRGPRSTAARRALGIEPSPLTLLERVRRRRQSGLTTRLYVEYHNEPKHIDVDEWHRSELCRLCRCVVQTNLREPAAWLHSYLGARGPASMAAEAGVSLGTPLPGTRPRAITRWLPLATAWNSAAPSSAAVCERLVQHLIDMQGRMVLEQSVLRAGEAGGPLAPCEHVRERSESSALEPCVRALLGLERGSSRRFDVIGRTDRLTHAYAAVISLLQPSTASSSTEMALRMPHLRSERVRLPFAYGAATNDSSTAEHIVARFLSSLVDTVVARSHVDRAIFQAAFSTPSASARLLDVRLGKEGSHGVLP